MKIKCHYCGKESEKETGSVNRANKKGLPLYCNRECAGKGRRVDKTIEQKKKDKAEYDKKYRELNEAIIKDKKKKYFAKDYEANPEKYKTIRKEKQPKHNEYCRQPEYRKKKKKYDQKYLVTKKYGEFAEAAIILFEIEKIIDSKIERRNKNLTNKTQKRKKLWKNLQQSA